MLNRITDKIRDYKDIKAIADSNFFDEEYYRKNYKGIKKGKLRAAMHYYYIGWTKGYNPSLKFDTNDYMESINQYNVNPLLHYELVGKYNTNSSLTSFIDGTSIKELHNNFFTGCLPLNAIPAINQKNKRFNIIFNGFDKSAFFGGKATELILAILFAKNNNYDLRIIAQNPESNIFYEFLKIFDIEYTGKVEFFSINSNKRIEIGPLDDFLCTMWVNADSILNTPEVTGKIFYMMQETETFFYDHGDMCLRCYNTLTNNRLIPIVNSKLLYDYLISDGYENVKNNGIYFEPIFSKRLLKTNKNTFSKKKKYKLFFYGRPSHQRNLFYFGIDVLNRAFNEGYLDPKEWIVYLAGDKAVPRFRFDCNVRTINQGVMSWTDYCNFMSNIDLCYSMIYTAHPSYPPLDCVTAGGVAVTNKYANKKDLSNYSKNIIMANLKEDEMLTALKRGAELAKNSVLRKNNYETTTTGGEWDEAFKNVIKFMNEKVED